MTDAVGAGPGTMMEPSQKNHFPRRPEPVFGAKDLTIATRLHFSEETSELSWEKANPTAKLEAFFEKATAVSRSVAIAVNKYEDRVREVAARFSSAGRHDSEGSRVQVEVISVPFWGAFTAALNALLAHARMVGSAYVLFASLEVPAEQAAVELLLAHFSRDTLVVGAALQGHQFQASDNGSEEHPLNGCTVPWNTFAIWRVRWLSMTSFLSIADGLPMEEEDSTDCFEDEKKRDVSSAGGRPPGSGGSTKSTLVQLRGGLGNRGGASSSSLPNLRAVAGGPRPRSDSWEEDGAGMALGSAGWWEDNGKKSSDRMRGSKVPCNVPAGVEEVTVVALLQMLNPSLEAKLIKLPEHCQLQWGTDWQGDEKRAKWHAHKMHTKISRPHAQLLAMFGNNPALVGGGSAPGLGRLPCCEDRRLLSTAPGPGAGGGQFAAGLILHYGPGGIGLPTRVSWLCLGSLFLVNLNTFALIGDLSEEVGGGPSSWLGRWTGRGGLTGPLAEALAGLSGPGFAGLVITLPQVALPLSLYAIRYLTRARPYKDVLLFVNLVLCVTNLFYVGVAVSHRFCETREASLRLIAEHYAAAFRSSGSGVAEAVRGGAAPPTPPALALDPTTLALLNAANQYPGGGSGALCEILPAPSVALVLVRLLQGLATGAFFFVRNIFASLITVELREQYMGYSFVAADLGIATAPLLLSVFKQWWLRDEMSRQEAAEITHSGTTPGGLLRPASAFAAAGPTGVEAPLAGAVVAEQLPFVAPCACIAGLAAAMVMLLRWRFPARVHPLPPLVQVQVQVASAAAAATSAAAAGGGNALEEQAAALPLLLSGGAEVVEKCGMKATQRYEEREEEEEEDNWDEDWGDLRLAETMMLRQFSPQPKMPICRQVSAPAAALLKTTSSRSSGKKEEEGRRRSRERLLAPQQQSASGSPPQIGDGDQQHETTTTEDEDHHRSGSKTRTTPTRKWEHHSLAGILPGSFQQLSTSRLRAARLDAVFAVKERSEERLIRNCFVSATIRVFLQWFVLTVLGCWAASLGGEESEASIGGLVPLGLPQGRVRAAILFAVFWMLPLPAHLGFRPPGLHSSSSSCAATGSTSTEPVRWVQMIRLGFGGAAFAASALACSAFQWPKDRSIVVLGEVSAGVSALGAAANPPFVLPMVAALLLFLAFTAPYNDSVATKLSLLGPGGESRAEEVMLKLAWMHAYLGRLLGPLAGCLLFSVLGPFACWLVVALLCVAATAIQ